jgi:Amt family ammonium transporter
MVSQQRTACLKLHALALLLLHSHKIIARPPPGHFSTVVAITLTNMMIEGQDTIAQLMASNQRLEAMVSDLSAQVKVHSHQFATMGDDYGPVSTLDAGDTAWMITATGLVLFMTVPGLGLYYSGITRPKNVLTTYIQCFTITCLVTFLWLVFGYSLAFGPSEQPTAGSPYYRHSSPVIGDASRFWFYGLGLDSVHMLATTIPESVFCMYQLTFAIITAALIVGSFADRMKYSSMIIFIGLWHLLVYCPVAHSVWHPSGFLFQAGVLDFAGGNVVHISSGISGLVSTLVLGPRIGFSKDKPFENYNLLLTATGAAMLWVGWYGFNAGSAVAANARAGYALLVTQIATAIASMCWMLTEWYVRKTPSVLGMVSGAIAGLVAITPASGYVDPTGAFFIGFLAGPICFLSSQLKYYFGYDDCLDAFGVHAIGGIVGGILTGFFATEDIAGAGLNGVFYGTTEVGGRQLGNQIYAIVVVTCYAAFCTFVILKVLEATVGMRVSEDIELLGLDQGIYGESATEYDRNKALTSHGAQRWSEMHAYFDHLKTDDDITAFFDSIDQDGNGFLDDVELRAALTKANIPISDVVLRSMMHAASGADTPAGQIGKKDFVVLMHKIKAASESMNTEVEIDVLTASGSGHRRVLVPAFEISHEDV